MDLLHTCDDCRVYHASRQGLILNAEVSRGTAVKREGHRVPLHFIELTI